MPTPTRDQITGLVLAGGRGSRMGGVDKGLQPHRGQPLALHALQRLAPQVGPLMISANRHLSTYAELGRPWQAAVWADTRPDHPGPLAGLLTGLGHCTTPWLATVPCDSPAFPQDLVSRLAEAAAAHGAQIVLAATFSEGRLHAQPVFGLFQATLVASLVQFLDEGERKVGAWTARHHTVQLAFDDAAAFFNVNTPEDLRGLQPPPQR